MTLRLKNRLWMFSERKRSDVKPKIADQHYLITEIPLMRHGPCIAGVLGGVQTITSKTSSHDESDRGKILYQGSCAAVPGSRDYGLPFDGKRQAWFLSDRQPANCWGESH